MHQQKTFFRRLDKKIKQRWPNYRLFCYISSGVMVLVLLPAFYCFLVDNVQQGQWADSPTERAEVVCVRTRKLYSTPPMAWVNNTWENTFRIEGVERTSQDQGSYRVDGRYLLNYQIAYTGQLRVVSSILLVK